MKCPDCGLEMADMEEKKGEKRGLWDCYCGLQVEERLSDDGCSIEYVTLRRR